MKRQQVTNKFPTDGSPSAIAKLSSPNDSFSGRKLLAFVNTTSEDFLGEAAIGAQICVFAKPVDAANALVLRGSPI